MKTKIKISGMGYLCVRDLAGEWRVVCKMTVEQLALYTEVIKNLKGQE